MPLHPEVSVELSGADGNAFMVLGKCTKAAKRVGIRQDEIDRFREEAMAGDHDHLLQTCMKWFDVS